MKKLWSWNQQVICDSSDNGTNSSEIAKQAIDPMTVDIAKDLEIRIRSMLAAS